MPAHPLSEGSSPGDGATGPSSPQPPAAAWARQPDPDRVIEPDADPAKPAEPEEPAGAPTAKLGTARPEPVAGHRAVPPAKQPDIPASRAQPGSAGPLPPEPTGDLAPRPGAEVTQRAATPPAVRSDPEVSPSWVKVAGTTLQLFLARRRTRWRVTVGLVLAVVIFVGGGLTVALIRNSGGAPAARAGRPASAPRTPGLAQVQAATAARLQTAAWVAAQVSHSAVVACDPAMCAALQAHGFPAGNLMTISPATSDPLGSTVIVATAAVRSQFGSRLETVFAPTVIASFGSGPAQIEVRVYAPGGAPAYLAALRADQATRQNLGRVLLRNARVSATPAARADLAAGRVDTRLLATIATLAGGGRVNVVAFGDSGPGASAGAPLRAAELASPPGANSRYLSAVLAQLRAEQAPYLATSLSLARVDGHEIVRIEFAAPSPLGLMSG